VRRRSGPAFRPTLHHGEAAFWLSRLHEDLSGVGPYWRNEQEHRNEGALAPEVRMPCELPGLAKTPFAGRALRSKAVVRGGNPERRGPTMVLVVFSFGAGWLFN
jgi:hypothetical protein